MGFFKSLTNVAFGKKSKGEASGFVDRERSWKKVVDKARGGQSTSALFGRREADRLYNKDPRAEASTRMARMMDVARTRGEDRGREASAQVAQRGLGRSSVGLNAILGAKEQSMKDIGKIQAGRGAMEQQLYRERAGDVSRNAGMLNSLMGAKGADRIYKAGKKGGKRGGGLAQIAATAAGAYFGGPQGAQMGKQSADMVGGMV